MFADELQEPTSMSSVPAPKSPAPMRYLFLFLLGLVVGIIGVVMVMRAIEGRKTAQDRFPEAVMHVMDSHMDMLDSSARANRCTATDTLPQLQALRMMANDIEPAFGDLREDARFAKHASDLRAALDASLDTPPLNCEGVAATLKNIGEACKACHQEFRN
jgi:hypothetical protein